MTKENTTVDLTQKTPLKDNVEEFKLIARDSLRMELISTRLTKITDLESEMSNADREINELDKGLKVSKYELTKLDPEHPKHEDYKENHEKNIENLEELIEREKKTKEEIQKELDHQLEKIILIETGETKVNLERLNKYVSELIKEHAKNRINQ